MSTPSNSRDSNNTSPTLDFDDVNQAFIATPSPSLQSPSPIRVRINNDKGENGKTDENDNNSLNNNNQQDKFHEKYDYTIQYDEPRNNNNYTPPGSYEDNYINNNNNVRIPNNASNTITTTSTNNNKSLKQPLLNDTISQHSYNSVNHMARNDLNKKQKNIHVQEESNKKKDDDCCGCEIM